MNKEELLKKFEKNVAYLQRNIPPDDIYIFTEQTFMAAMYFMHKWAEWADVQDEMKKDPITRKWVNNILGFQKVKDEDIDIQIDLKMKTFDELL